MRLMRPLSLFAAVSSSPRGSSVRLMRPLSLFAAVLSSLLLSGCTLSSTLLEHRAESGAQTARTTETGRADAAAPTQAGEPEELSTLAAPAFTPDEVDAAFLEAGARIEADGTVVFGPASTPSYVGECAGRSITIEAPYGNLLLSGRCEHVVVRGEANVLQFDEVGRLSVQADYTSVIAHRIEAMDAVRGELNSIRWNEGVSAGSVDAGGSTNILLGP